jgi:integrase
LTGFASEYLILFAALNMNRENQPKFRPNPKLRLMNQGREVLRHHHYAYRTEQTCCQRILRYIRYFGEKTHPKLLGHTDVKTTGIYTHVMSRDIRNLQSPLDKFLSPEKK